MRHAHHPTFRSPLVTEPEDTIVDHLIAKLGTDVVLEGDAMPLRAFRDSSGQEPTRPLALVRPQTAEEVSVVLGLCHQLGISVVPQAGLTGLAGGAHPVAAGIALSLERMTGVEEIDPLMGTMTVRAGTPLQAVQEAADKAGFLFALDLGARGSCTIGGVIATNAGGNRVIRYGMAREHILGLEVVLPDGQIVTSLNKLIKNNAGYDLKQLFIGSEGTLGVVTRAVLRLQPAPASTTAALVGCSGFDKVPAILAAARTQFGPSLSAFEAMWPDFYDFMVANIPASGSPLGGKHGLYLLVEASEFEAGREVERLENMLAALMQAGVIEDAVVARSNGESKTLWSIREGVSEYRRLLGKVVSFDIGLQTASIGQFVEEVRTALSQRWPGILSHFYGHIGDSNLHIVTNLPAADATAQKADITRLVYDRVRKAGGTVSAEHGIGTQKLPYLSYSRTSAEVALMALIKRALDPRNIMNTGKVLPLG